MNCPVFASRANRAKGLAVPATRHGIRSSYANPPNPLRRGSDSFTLRIQPVYANTPESLLGLGRKVRDHECMSKSRLIALIPSREKVFFWAIVIASATVCAFRGVDAAGL